MHIRFVADSVYEFTVCQWVTAIPKKPNCQFPITQSLVLFCSPVTSNALRNKFISLFFEILPRAGSFRKSSQDRRYKTLGESFLLSQTLLLASSQSTQPAKYCHWALGLAGRECIAIFIVCPQSTMLVLRILVFHNHTCFSFKHYPLTWAENHSGISPLNFTSTLSSPFPT